MKTYILVLVPAVVLLALAASVRAAELEHRTFAVTLDGKPAGEYRMTIQTLDDGTQILAAQTAWTTKLGNATWRYSFRALETWKGGRLQKLESFTDDDGKKRHVVAGIQGQNLRVLVNDHRHDVRLDVWTNSFWFVPTVSQRSQAVVLFDTDTGLEKEATLDYIGPQRRTFAGKDLQCSHYRVRGGTLTADLWYDGADRLVRQELSRDGRKIVLELSKTQK